LPWQTRNLRALSREGNTLALSVVRDDFSPILFLPDCARINERMNGLFYFVLQATRRPVSENPTMMTTMLNTKSEVALPGYLVMDPARQLRVEDHIAVGGGGAVYVATLIDPVLKEQNGDNDKVVVKEVKPLDQLTEEQNLLLVKQEVAAMA